MPKFMLDHRCTIPPHYVPRSCLLVQYRLPLLRYCFIVCHDAHAAAQEASDDLGAFFWAEARRLAFAAVGDAEAFVLIYSGASIRRRTNSHAHVFVIQHRWQKAWLYTVLGAKNTALALYCLFQRQG